MSDETFQVKVFSGRGLEFEGSVRSVSVPSESGELGFLPRHCDYVGLLATGVVVCSQSDGALRKCIVSGGICTFADNVLTLLADTVDLPESLDLRVLSEDVALLQTQLQAISLFDPEWEVLSQRVARIEALKSFGAHER